MIVNAKQRRDATASDTLKTTPIVSAMPSEVAADALSKILQPSPPEAGPMVKGTGLTEAQVAILDELARRGEYGGLSGVVAGRLFGLGSPARVRRPCLKMAEAGLVVRHETNHERWHITDLGRAALAERGGAE